MKKEWKKYISFGVTIFLVYLGIHYWTSFTGLVGVVFQSAKSLFLGAMMAYVVNILMSFYEKHYFTKGGARVQKSKRVVCLMASILTLVGLVSLLISIILPELFSCIKVISDGIPELLNSLGKYLDGNQPVEELLPADVIATLQSADGEAMVTKALKFLSAGIGGVAGSVVTTVSTVVSSTVTFFIGAIFGMYILTGKEKLGSQCKRVLHTYVKPEWNRRIMVVLDTLNECFHKFIVGQCTEAVILGGLCTAGMMLCRLPYASMIGALIGFTALIPVAGAYIGAGVGAFMILTVSPMKALVFIVFIVILQQLEGNLIYPRVVGSSIGLPGLWVLAAVTIGGGISGVVGMLFAVPLTAAAYQLISRDVARREKDRRTV